MVQAEIKPKIHELKTWEEYFWAVYTESKPFEILKNDRNFQVNDFVKLREYDPETKQYGKHEKIALISYVLQGGQFGLEKGYCILGLDFNEIHHLLLTEKKY